MNERSVFGDRATRDYFGVEETAEFREARPRPQRPQSQRQRPRPQQSQRPRPQRPRREAEAQRAPEKRHMPKAVKRTAILGGLALSVATIWTGVQPKTEGSPHDKYGDTPVVGATLDKVYDTSEDIPGVGRMFWVWHRYEENKEEITQTIDDVESKVDEARDRVENLPDDLPDVDPGAIEEEITERLPDIG